MQDQDIIQKGLSFNEAGDHRIIVGPTREELGIVDPGNHTVTNATFLGLEKYVEKRKDAINSRAHETNVVYDLEKRIIVLNVGENGKHRKFKDSELSTVSTITAFGALSEDFKEVKGLMSKTHSDAHELFQTLRHNDHLFSNQEEWARVTGSLRSAVVNIKAIYENTSDDAGARSKVLRGTIDNSQLDLEWNWEVPVIEGGAKHLIFAKALWELDEVRKGSSGLEARLVLLGRAFKEQERTVVKQEMDRVLQSIQTMLPNVPMIQVY